MLPDQMGFFYPNVDENKCVDCGLCEKVCAFNSDYETLQNFNEPVIYAARNTDPKVVSESQSGGVFFTLAEKILREGGIVYGAGYDEDFCVKHKRAETLENLSELRKSKYVQSDMVDCFHLAMRDIKEGRNVLFSGTPCQIAGLNAFLNLKKVDLGCLYTCSLVCHGTPAPQIWRDNLDYIEKKTGEKISGVNFRNKKLYGWRSHHETYTFSGSNKILTSRLYTDLFYKHLTLRYCCGSCHFSNFNRPSDISIADFWGIGKIKPEWEKEDKGVSLVIISTTKGQDLFDGVKDYFEYLPSNKEQCAQPNLLHSSELSSNRDAFEKEFLEKGFMYVAKKYGTIGIRYQIKRVIRAFSHLPQRISKFFKKRKL